MKVIVHIGTEKTGSTSIQKYLYQNRRRLNKAGFHYLQSGAARNSRALASFCTSDHKGDDFLASIGVVSSKEKAKFKRDYIKDFRVEIKSLPKHIHTVIISSEHLHSRTNSHEEVNTVYELLSPLFSKIKIVCYIREQLATSVSLYSTAIKSGKVTPFNKFLLNCKPDNIYYNYYEMLNNWNNIFGLESLDISLFDSKTFVNEDLLDDFTSKIHPELIGKLDKNIKVENESLTYPGQVLGKAINKVFSWDCPEQVLGKAKNKMFSKNSKKTGLSFIRIKCLEIVYKKCKGVGELPSINTKNDIYNKFKESNEKLRRKYFPNSDVLFSPLSKGSVTDKVIDDEFIDVISDVMSMIISNHKCMGFPDRYADLFRDAALRVEKNNVRSAYELMGLAAAIRPSGPFINEKLEEYRQFLN